MIGHPLWCPPSGNACVYLPTTLTLQSWDPAMSLLSTSSCRFLGRPCSWVPAEELAGPGELQWFLEVPPSAPILDLGITCTCSSRVIPLHSVALGDQKHHQLNSSYKFSFTEAQVLGEALPCGHQHMPSVENVNLKSSLPETEEMAWLSG